MPYTHRSTSPSPIIGVAQPVHPKLPAQLQQPPDPLWRAPAARRTCRAKTLRGEIPRHQARSPAAASLVRPVAQRILAHCRTVGVDVVEELVGAAAAAAAAALLLLLKVL